MTEELIAKPAVKREATLKVLAYGESGSGKTRLALSFPDPIVADSEKGSTLYADEFEFWLAEPTPGRGFHQVVLKLVQQLGAQLYPDRKTLVIDSTTDFLDKLEAGIIADMAQKGTNIETMSGMKKAQAYSQLNDRIRVQLEAILSLPMNVVFLTRSKNVWGKVDGQMQPIGRTYDGKEILEYLADVVLEVQKGGTALVKKSRLKNLPSEIPAASFLDLKRAIETAPAAPVQATPQGPARPGSSVLANQPVDLEDGPPYEEDSFEDAGFGADVPQLATGDQLTQLRTQVVRLFGKLKADEARSLLWIRAKLGMETPPMMFEELSHADAETVLQSWLATPKDGMNAWTPEGGF